MALSSAKLHKPWNYLLLTLGLTWLFWIPAALSGIPEPAPLPSILHYLGGSMPFVVVMVILFRQENRAYRREYWRRLVEVKRIPWRWLLLLVLIVPAIYLLAGGLDHLLGGRSPGLESRFISAPLSLIPFAFFSLLFGPLPEELGWRGFWLDKLRSRYSGLTASLIITVGWSIWHLPLFFMSGYPLQEFTASAARLAVYFLLLLPLSIIYAYVFYRNNRSTISAILFHFMVNFTGSIIAIELQTEWIQLFVYSFAAILIVNKHPQIFFRNLLA